MDQTLTEVITNWGKLPEGIYYKKISYSLQIGKIRKMCVIAYVSNENDIFATLLKIEAPTLTTALMIMAEKVTTFLEEKPDAVAESSD